MHRWLALASGAQLLLSSAHLQWDGVTRTNLPSLQVGRWPGEQDIVAEGLVTPTWDPSTPAVFEVPAYQFRCRFNAEATAVDFAPVSLESVTAVANTSDLEVTAHPNGTLPGELEVWIHFTCLASAAAKVDVTLNLGAPFLSPTWSFTKLCRQDPHLGLNVVALPGSQAVVAKGAPLWLPSHVVPYGAFELQLYVSVDREPSAILTPPQVTVAAVASAAEAHALVKAQQDRQAAGRWARTVPVETSLLDVGAAGLATALRSLGSSATLRRASGGAARPADLVEVTGALLQGGVLENNGTAADLALRFHCPHPGSFAVEVALELFPAYQPYHPVAVQFVKVCGGATRTGFHVGTGADAQSLVADGKVVGTGPSVDNLTPKSVFAVAYQPLGPYDLDQSPDVEISCQSVLGETIVSLAVSATHDQLAVEYSCNQPGLALCEMQFGFTMWQRPAPVKWSKECFGPRRDVMVTTELESAPLAVQDGAVVAEWALALPWDDDTLRLYINASADLMVSSVSAREAGDWATLKSEIMTWTATASGKPAGDPFLVSKAPVLLELRANCSADGSRDVAVVVDLGLFDSLKIPLRKTCRMPRWYEDGWTLAGAVFAGVVVVAVPVTGVVLWVMK